ncbi:MAG TPA: hypothetical protein VKV39_11950 [Candidatus Sulfotelmatobacter sp.]|nr:hypothetical protein [Candidatus Sulfotelmatobacter sp.]
MTGLLKNLRSSGSLAGVFLIGLGTFLLYENAVGAMAWITGHGAVKALPAILLSAVQFEQLLSAANHWRLAQCLAHRALIETWPALLVLAGTILARLP